MQIVLPEIATVAAINPHPEAGTYSKAIKLTYSEIPWPNLASRNLQAAGEPVDDLEMCWLNCSNMEPNLLHELFIFSLTVSNGAVWLAAKLLLKAN